MSDTVISVKEVSKKYRLFDSPKERLIEALHPLRKRYHKEFWALRDIGFDVFRGQTLGILGRNGSGKSTLLQLIAGILQPTGGQIMVKGRISALLELGTGFNPEFTGRNNVILSGGIMGISRREMLARLPEIESFADIGEFFDQPVKTYSSGMNARLGFAAAINLDPEILIVDEILAVGDAKFQNKCYMKLKEFRAHGKTILFVSHSTESVIRHCDHCILLEGGRLVASGAPQDIVDSYLELLFSSVPGRPRLEGVQVPLTGVSNGAYKDVKSAVAEFVKARVVTPMCQLRNTYNKNEHRYGDGGAEIVDYLIATASETYPLEVDCGTALNLYIKVLVKHPVDLLSVGFALRTVDGLMLYGINTMAHGLRIANTNAGEVICVKFAMLLAVGPGDLFFDLGCGDWSRPPIRPLDRRHSIVHIRVNSVLAFDGLANLSSSASVESRANSQQ